MDENDIRKEVTHKMWDLLRTAGFEGRFSDANVQIIIDYVCKNKMPPADLIISLLRHGQQTQDTSDIPLTVLLDADSSTTEFTSSHDFHTNPTEMPREYSKHLNTIQFILKCANSGGIKLEDTMNSNKKQEASNSIEEGENVDVTDDCHNLVLKQMSQSYTSEYGESCGSTSECDSRQDSSDGPCCISEVKNVIEAKAWWNREHDGQGVQSKYEMNHPPEGDSGVSQDDARMRHNNFERIRRQEISELFLALHIEVPNICSQPKASRILILNEATSYIEELKILHRHQEYILSQEQRKQKLLKKTLQKLQASVSRK